MMVTMAKCCGANVDPFLLLDKNRVPERRYVIRCFDLEPRRRWLLYSDRSKLASGRNVPGFGVNIENSHRGSAA